MKTQIESILNDIKTVAVEMESAIDIEIIHGNNHTAAELQDFMDMLEDILHKYTVKGGDAE